MRKKLPIPDFKSVQEEANFWDIHSFEDFPDYWQPAPEVKFSKARMLIRELLHELKII